MHAKGLVNDKSHSNSTEVIYILHTISGEDHQITEQNYDEIKLRIAKAEMHGSFVLNEDTDQELVIPLKYVELIRKERKEEEVI